MTVAGKKKKRDKEDRKKRRSKKSSSSSVAALLSEKPGKSDAVESDVDCRKLRDALLHRRLPQHITDPEDEFLYGASADAAPRESGLAHAAPTHEKPPYG